MLILEIKEVSKDGKIFKFATLFVRLSYRSIYLTSERTVIAEIFKISVSDLMSMKVGEYPISNLKID